MVFQCITIHQVPREVLKTQASGLGFQHLPRDLANVNAWKTMFDPYINKIRNTWDLTWENIRFDMKIQISLRIRSVWSVFVVCLKNFASLPIQNVLSEESHQTGHLNLHLVHMSEDMFFDIIFNTLCCWRWKNWRKKTNSDYVYLFKLSYNRQFKWNAILPGVGKKYIGCANQNYVFKVKA